MKIKKYKNIILAAIILIVAIIIFGIYQVQTLNKAHSTFENYYAFRGCSELIDKTDVSGVCQLDSGKTIKIVKFNDKWYLDGDLPCGFLCF